MTSKAGPVRDRMIRNDRLGFRLDGQTLGLIERAALLERGKISNGARSAMIA